MPNLTINNKVVSVPEGDYILDACRKAGVAIPTMCFLEGYPPFTSCMICLVKDRKTGKLLPSCSVPAVDGMDIETDSAEVHSARRTALELLLSEHIGDCEGPCQRGCPAHMNIPLMIRQILAGEYKEAVATVKKDIALPAVLGRICPAPCEKVCRRAGQDSPLAICLLKRYVADVDLASANPYLPGRRPATGKKVAIVGAGPCGLACAYYLLQEGHACRIIDDHEKAGGMLRYGVTEEALPRDVLEKEIDVIRRLGADIRLNVRLGRDIQLDKLREEFDAVVLAPGKIELAAVAALGLAATDKGIKVNMHTFETDKKGIFAGGAAVQPGRMAVRAVEAGKLISAAVDQFLAGHPADVSHKRFNSQIGRLLAGELAEFMKEARDVPRVAPGGGNKEGFSKPEAERESARCLHCDCRKPEACRLREYSQAYGAEQRRYGAGDRKKFEQIREHPSVIFETGKCVKCGNCVRITERAGERLGLAFVGRGFNVRIGVPFNKSFAEALEKTAKECVDKCPTGALSFRS